MQAQLSTRQIVRRYCDAVPDWSRETLENARISGKTMFSRAAGDKGPQATLVRLIDKHHLD